MTEVHDAPADAATASASASGPASAPAPFLVRLYAIASRPGWTRRLLLAGAVAVFLVCLLILLGGVDYRQDPSALVPRTADLFAETRDLDTLLKNVGHWQLWDEAHRVRDDEPRNLFQIEAVQYFSSRVPDLGTYIPFLWLSDVKRAALAVADGEGEGEKAWALYLQTADVGRVLSEMRLEPKIRLDGPEGREGVFELVGENGGTLFLGVLAPWIIVSSDRQLPEFAFAIMKKPSLSLANAKLLPDWRRRTSVRGVATPVYLAARPGAADLLAGLGGWVDPRARVAFTAAVNADDALTATLAIATLSSSTRGGGAWPIIKLALAVAALAAAALALFVLLVMLGWGTRFKLAARRAGVTLRDEPLPVTPSAAFREDAGGPRAAEDATAQLPPDAAATHDDVPVDDPDALIPPQNQPASDVPTPVETTPADAPFPDEREYVTPAPDALQNDTDLASRTTQPDSPQSPPTPYPDTKNDTKTDSYL